MAESERNNEERESRKEKGAVPVLPGPPSPKMWLSQALVAGYVHEHILTMPVVPYCLTKVSRCHIVLFCIKRIDNAYRAFEHLHVRLDLRRVCHVGLYQ